MDADAGTRRAAAVETRNKAQEQRGALWEKYGEKIPEIQNKRDDIDACLHDGYDDGGDREDGRGGRQLAGQDGADESGAVRHGDRRGAPEATPT